MSRKTSISLNIREIISKNPIVKVFIYYCIALAVIFTCQCILLIVGYLAYTGHLEMSTAVFSLLDKIYQIVSIICDAVADMVTIVGIVIGTLLYSHYRDSKKEQ